MPYQTHLANLQGGQLRAKHSRVDLNLMCWNWQSGVELLYPWMKAWSHTTCYQDLASKKLKKEEQLRN